MHTKRLWGLIWASPITLVGVVLGFAFLLFGARWRIVQGVLEVESAWVRRLLKFPWMAGHGFSAITIGHVIFGQSAGILERSRVHEHVHVRQCERWGILFPFAYLGSSLWALARGKHPYWDNAFEREAYAVEEGEVRSEE